MTEADSETVTEAETETVTEADADSETEAETVTEAETEAEAETVTEADSEAEVDSETEADSGTSSWCGVGGSASAIYGLSALGEGGEALIAILAEQRGLVALALNGERFLHRHLERALHRRLGGAHR